MPSASTPAMNFFGNEGVASIRTHGMIGDFAVSAPINYRYAVPNPLSSFNQRFDPLRTFEQLARRDRVHADGMARGKRGCGDESPEGSNKKHRLGGAVGSSSGPPEKSWRQQAGVQIMAVRYLPK